VTTAIVRDGVLLLLRALELEPEMRGGPEGALPGDAGYAPIEAEAEMQAEILSEARQPSIGREVAQAVSVAAAYFEDTLSSLPELLLAAGTTGAESLESMLHANGLGGLRVREMMEPGMLDAGAATVRVPRGWLAGVKGALTS
jgi:type IV pilus assembly protein PilM